MIFLSEWWNITTVMHQCSEELLNSLGAVLSYTNTSLEYFHFRYFVLNGQYKLINNTVFLHWGITTLT